MVGGPQQRQPGGHLARARFGPVLHQRRIEPLAGLAVDGAVRSPGDAVELPRYRGLALRGETSSKVSLADLVLEVIEYIFGLNTLLCSPGAACALCCLWRGWFIGDRLDRQRGGLLGTSLIGCDPTTDAKRADQVEAEPVEFLGFGYQDVVFIEIFS